MGVLGTFMVLLTVFRVALWFCFLSFPWRAALTLLVGWEYIGSCELKTGLYLNYRGQERLVRALIRMVKEEVTLLVWFWCGLFHGVLCSSWTQQAGVTCLSSGVSSHLGHPRPRASKDSMLWQVEGRIWATVEDHHPAAAPRDLLGHLKTTLDTWV